MQRCFNQSLAFLELLYYSLSIWFGFAQTEIHQEISLGSWLEVGYSSQLLVYVLLLIYCIC